MNDPFLDLAEENTRRLNSQPRQPQNGRSVEALADARYAVENDRWISDDDTRRIWRILMLSTSLEVFETLLRREQVPIDHLDSEWVRRLGIKRRRAA